MHPKIEEASREIIELFNAKAKNGIARIKEICDKENISSAETIGEFLYQQRQNLDLESVGDYLSGPEEENKEALQAFTGQLNFEGQSFVNGLRIFLKAFKLPGEAQKIDRLVKSFSEAYCQQNPDVIANEDAAYLLAFQTIMLNTDLHNPSIAEQNKMTLDGLVRNLKGTNNGGDFNPEFLRTIYNEIKAKPFEFNFVKVNPGYEINFGASDNDPAFEKLNSIMGSSVIDPKNLIPGISDSVKATVAKPKPWLAFLTGYEGTILLADEKTKGEASIQIYKPGIFSKLFFGEQPKVIVQPAGTNKASIDLAAKVAAGFKTPVSSIKATYDYEHKDLESAYQHEKKLASIEQTKNYKEQIPRESQPEIGNINTPRQ
ncbi:T4SS guanine nucleotide exchange effector RalF [Legionella shakespearei]|uniref:RalF protein, translocated into host cells by the Dot/Icm system n=1 Tax=Legionella shakespearei DSM 23087 TaxID=1122169 RepID=A0A0W0YWQ9_9GAMM|nr:T4SS guanine nucleotide exchange effector RalF [Legionella shakespearei]KTD60934.1 RalF protein, translocated into host cells by the Dot/Icm system [Legionella shakespearei DSM 23087]